MRPTLYPIEGPWPGRLAILPRPRGGDWLEDEVLSWQEAGIGLVVSLLTPSEVSELELSQEQELCRRNGIAWTSLPIPDRGVPASRQVFRETLLELEKTLAQGDTVGIHCRQGIGRSAMLAAGVLLLAGLDADAAFQRVGLARGCSVPDTEEQRQWVTEFGRKLAPSQKAGK